MSHICPQESVRLLTSRGRIKSQQGLEHLKHWLQLRNFSFTPHSCPAWSKLLSWRLLRPRVSRQHVINLSLMRISWESPKTLVPSPNKWTKRKAALLSPLPLSVLWTLVSDEFLSCPYRTGSHAMLSHGSLPRGPHRKSQLPGHREKSNSTAFR